MVDWLKDPVSVLDFNFDWSAWLKPGETITTSTMEPSPGISINSSSNTTTMATAWVAGGTSGRAYTVSNKIITSQGRTDERSVTIRCTNR